MSDRTIAAQTPETFVTMMTERMAALARTLSDWVQAEARPLQEIEEQLVRVLHDLGQTMLAGLCQLAAPSRPAPAVACPCGATARYVRMRPATVTTVLGTMTITRAYYACAACRQGQAPLDAQLQVAAGGLSAGLTELLALLGATQDSFAQATEVLARRCLVEVCPNRARAATEDLGDVLRAHADAVIAQAEATHTPPAAATPAPPRISVSMDGVLAHDAATLASAMSSSMRARTRTHRASSSSSISRSIALGCWIRHSRMPVIISSVRRCHVCSLMGRLIGDSSGRPRYLLLWYQLLQDFTWHPGIWMLLIGSRTICSICTGNVCRSLQLTRARANSKPPGTGLPKMRAKKRWMVRERQLSSSGRMVPTAFVVLSLSISQPRNGTTKATLVPTQFWQRC